jgi:ABC-type antimicrobial peptide transport system permease subunit
MALGAGRADVLRMIMGRTLALAAAGILSGLMASLAMSGALRNALFGISESDPLTYGAVALGFLFLAAVAASLPARRALRIDPVRALKSE